MDSLIITPKNKAEFRFIEAVLKRMNVSSKKITIDELEDLGMASLIAEADLSKKVSRETIMKTLNQ